MILVDTSVLLDVLAGDVVWADRSQAALKSASATDDLTINDIIYAELTTYFDSFEALDRVIDTMELRHAVIPRAALFLAGKAFLQDRSRRGTRTGVLSDFFVGAHAAAEDWPLLTRDTRRIASYFPSVQLITPVQ
jgi:predicted nucleic acid-binding protein